MEIPQDIDRAITSAVTSRLEAELGDRELLLTAADLLAAEAETARRGSRLLARVLELCYPDSPQGGETLVLEFQSDRTAERLGAALTFGAVTANLLGAIGREPGPSQAAVELTCAVFNLGIGLVDGLCDDDAQVGGHLLALLPGGAMAAAAERRPPRRWLLDSLSPALCDDPTAAFASAIIEVFFQALHAGYAGRAGASVRRGLGAQLEAALEAERESVDRSAQVTGRERLIECSRRTSVLPFRILQTLALGREVPAEPSAGPLLGEAMWRIDDLVDLCQDARCGALNGVLLAATRDPVRDGERGRLAALERLLVSPDIAATAARAGEDLQNGLRLAAGARTDPFDRLATRSFLYFIQRYAGIPAPGDVTRRRGLPTPS